MKAVGLTHRGLKREKNEDRYLINEMADDFILLGVADGVGGEVAGEYAAEIMIHELASMKPDSENRDRDLVLMVERADHAMRCEAEKNSSLEGMGTTVTGVLVGEVVAYWVHVGDTRLYVLRNQKMIQVTRDQNMGQFLIDEGEITEEEARSHQMRNLLEQCVGCGDCKPDSGQLEIKPKDLLILCSDGLYREVNTETTISLLTSQTDIKKRAKSLIQAALDAGGKDNVTIVIAEI
jgi:protein phosphatase